MTFSEAKVTGKVSCETLGCEAGYFKKFIKGKPLKIVYSSPNHYIRVQDENQEEWGLFPGQYALLTDSAGQETLQKAKAAKAELSGKKAH